MQRHQERPGASATAAHAPSRTVARCPQGLGSQLAALEDTGTVVLSSNAEAARFAALVPDLAALLGGAPCASRRFWLDRGA